MKDQHQVLHKCLTEDVPAFVLTGKDVCAIATLKTYLREFERFQSEDPQKVKIPD